MFNVGSGEVALILVVALLLLGPQRLPELARGLGKFLREFRRQTDEVRSMVEREFYKMDQDITDVPSSDALPPSTPSPERPFPTEAPAGTESSPAPGPNHPATWRSPFHSEPLHPPAEPSALPSAERILPDEVSASSGFLRGNLPADAGPSPVSSGPTALGSSPPTRVSGLPTSAPGPTAFGPGAVPSAAGTPVPSSPGVPRDFGARPIAPSEGIALPGVPAPVRSFADIPNRAWSNPGAEPESGPGVDPEAAGPSKPPEQS